MADILINEELKERMNYVRGVLGAVGRNPLSRTRREVREARIERHAIVLENSILIHAHHLPAATRTHLAALLSGE